MPKNKNDDAGQDGASNTRGNSVPLQIFLIIALVVIVIYFLSKANTPTATITLPPTYTQQPTYTAFPTLTPPPSYTPLATNTPRPTYTALPTLTPPPTYTLRPSYTPLATNTPRPTYTALPTFTPLPTTTPTTTPSVTPTGKPTSTPTHTPTPTPIPSRIIIEQIQPKGQLVVVSVEVARADIHITVDDGRWCSHNGDFVAQGAIEAGIDFGALDEDNVTYDWATDSYTLHLPAPGLTSCRIEYIRQYSNSFSLCNPDWDRVRILAHYEAVSSFVDKVIEEGLLERAKDQADLVLGSFVSSFTGKSVNVEFDAETAPPVLPSSCEPDIPSGYSFNDESNEWTKTD